MGVSFKEYINQIAHLYMSDVCTNFNVSILQQTRLVKI